MRKKNMIEHWQHKKQKMLSSQLKKQSKSPNLKPKLQLLKRQRRKPKQKWRQLMTKRSEFLPKRLNSRNRLQSKSIFLNWLDRKKQQLKEQPKPLNNMLKCGKNKLTRDKLPLRPP